MAEMKEKINEAIFSSSGASIAVGGAGFLSALVGMFLDTSIQVSVKWLLLIIWSCTTILIILLKIIFDLSSEKRPPAPFEVPIRYLDEDKLLLIRRNDNFTNQIVVGCYSSIDDIERLLFLGAVHHVQENFIQIRILHNPLNDSEINGKDLDIKRIIVRPVVPLSAIQDQIMGSK